MTATELIQLIFGLHQPDRVEERRTFYAALEPYLIETDYDWQAAMNEPIEEGLIMSGVDLVWARDTTHGLHFGDTPGKRYLLPPAFAWTNGIQRWTKERGSLTRPFAAERVDIPLAHRPVEIVA